MDAERRSQGSAGQWGFIGQSFSYSLLESRFWLTLISCATHVGPRATSPWTNMCVQNTLSLLILLPLDTRGCIWKQRVSSLISGAFMSFVLKVKKDWRDQSSAKTAKFFFRKGFRFPEVSSTYYQKIQNLTSPPWISPQLYLTLPIEIHVSYDSKQTWGWVEVTTVFIACFTLSKGTLTHPAEPHKMWHFNMGWMLLECGSCDLKKKKENHLNLHFKCVFFVIHLYPHCCGWVLFLLFLLCILHKWHTILALEAQNNKPTT